MLWAFDAPQLLTTGALAPEDLNRRLDPYRERELRALEKDPAPLLEFLAARPTHGRLGRYFEHLLQFYLICLARAERVTAGLQIREGKKTLGELDLVFQDAVGIHHWEASVKFYLCIASTSEEAHQTKYFLGTLVQDRLDVKLEKLLVKQLGLSRNPFAEAALVPLGLSQPKSQALLKGYLFYPASANWREHPHPVELARNHDRGWWTTDAALELPSESSRYILLPQSRWLARFEGTVDVTYSANELRALINDYFGNDAPVFREMMIAEVNEVAPGIVREITRGHIAHRDWPAYARQSL